MPPKKATEAVKDNVVAFGRVRKNLKMGCVGLPNVGKSSLFNLLTEQSASAENYPFCTIEPNEARCAVPDTRYVSPEFFSFWLAATRDLYSAAFELCLLVVSMADVLSLCRTFCVIFGSPRPCS